MTQFYPYKISQTANDLEGKSIFVRTVWAALKMYVCVYIECARIVYTTAERYI